MCIVTGPRIDLAIALIDRMKKLFAAAAVGSSSSGSNISISSISNSTTKGLTVFDTTLMRC
jgi:TRAP-type uncharacterized transport system fused permease subunit